MTILETRTLHWPNEAACAATAAALAARPGLAEAFVTLHGTLGAGKTSFARHLLQALGVAGRIKSPTYTVVESHAVPASPAGRPAFEAHHFDFYRFEDPQEWEDAGLRELFAGPGLKLAEWPERVGGLLPPADLALHLAIDAGDPGARTVRLEAGSVRGRALLPEPAA
nr:tRNA (adenosine(37)-N6)-threonylcarbamoyltransferase complex ATPase subunit type 1 TsaE [Piscinibacter sakaiensis]